MTSKNSYQKALSSIQSVKALFSLAPMHNNICIYDASKNICITCLDIIRMDGGRGRREDGVWGGGKREDKGENST